jgi:hypothetical protein
MSQFSAINFATGSPSKQQKTFVKARSAKARTRKINQQTKSGTVVKFKAGAELASKV